MKLVLIGLGLGLSVFAPNAFSEPRGYYFNARDVRGYDGNRAVSPRTIDYNHGSEAGGRIYSSTSGSTSSSNGSADPRSAGAVSPWVNQYGILFHNQIPEGFATDKDKMECERKAKDQALSVLVGLEKKCEAEKMHFGVSPRYSYPDKSTDKNKKEFKKALATLDVPGAFEVASARVDSIAGNTTMKGTIRFACKFNQFNYDAYQAIVWNQSIEFSGEVSVALIAAYFQETDANHFNEEKPVRGVSLLGAQMAKHCEGLNPDPSTLQYTGVVMDSCEPFKANFGTATEGIYTCMARSTARFACAPAPAGFSRPWDEISPGRSYLGDVILPYFWVSDFSN
jgi:hypothetical protein